jgi:hypothetical protein
MTVISEEQYLSWQDIPQELVTRVEELQQAVVMAVVLS